MFLLRMSSIYASVMIFLFFILITLMQDNVEAEQQCSPEAHKCDKAVSTTPDQVGKHEHQNISKDQVRSPTNLPREILTEEVKTLLSRRQYDVRHEKMLNDQKNKKKTKRPTTEKPKNESSSEIKPMTPEEFYIGQLQYECLPGTTIIKSEEECKVCVCSADGQELCLDRKLEVNECTYIAGLKNFLRGRQLVHNVRRVNLELANSRCVPFISQYTDCTEDNLCNGCRRCTCDAKGSWSCKDISECGTADSNLRRSQDSVEEEYVDSRRFDKASKLLGNEIEEMRKSTLYGDNNIQMPSGVVPNEYRSQDFFLG